MVNHVLSVAVKRGNIRGELFNTSFLLLCHIGQVYGRKVGFILTSYPGGTPKKPGWGCVARFSKPLIFFSLTRLLPNKYFRSPEGEKPKSLEPNW